MQSWLLRFSPSGFGAKLSPRNNSPVTLVYNTKSWKAWLSREGHWYCNKCHYELAQKTNCFKLAWRQVAVTRREFQQDWSDRKVLGISRFYNTSKMLTEGHKDNSGDEPSGSDMQVEQTPTREVGRLLANIGDNLNQEVRARRSEETETVIHVFQLANLGGVNMSFLIPIHDSFQYETDVSLLVFIISFYTSRRFFRVRDS